jgi:phosphocarrier protein HPr
MSSAKKIDKLDSPMVSQCEMVVANKLGIHARPAAMFVKLANQFQCDIFVEKDGERVNGKSIMGLMMLAAGPGNKIVVHAHGQDGLRALEEIQALLDRKFDED